MSRIFVSFFAFAILFANPGTKIAPANSFVVVTPVQNAQEYDDLAEKEYLKQSKYWFGKPHRQLSTPCRIKIDVGNDKPSCGATSFEVRSRNQVLNFNMSVSGSKRNILRRVLPHEVCHVVLHSGLGRKIPRCFDEGAATLQEEESMHTWYANYLKSKMPLRIRWVLDTYRYPERRYVLTFYAMSHVIAKHLVSMWGPKKYISFLQDPRPPTKKLKAFYGITPEELDTAWRKKIYTRTRRVVRSPIYVFSSKNYPPRS